MLTPGRCLGIGGLESEPPSNPRIPYNALCYGVIPKPLQPLSTASVSSLWSVSLFIRSGDLPTTPFVDVSDC